jgi:transcriptional regulator with XRE-family HTH domain
MTRATLLSFEDARSRTSPLTTETTLIDQFFPEKITRVASFWKPACSTVLTCMLVGTGGTASGATVAWVAHDSLAYRVIAPAQIQLNVPLFVDTSERMTGLRRYFSLTVTDLARVLRVERPTIYAWLKGSSAPHSGNLRRLEKIYRLAQEWRAKSSIPMGTYVREPFDDGRSVLDYLAEEHLQERMIRYAFTEIKSRLDQEQETKHARRRSVDESARVLGFPTVSAKEQKKNFDEATSL